MHTKNLVIGAGISGLALSFFLRNKPIVLEQSDRAGGWLQTKREKGFLFEMGPRAFKADKSSALLSLIDRLNLSDDIIYSSQKVTKRYLSYQNKAYPIPTSLKKALSSPLTKGLVWPLIRGLFRRAKSSDETAAQFLQRRCNHPKAKAFLDAFSTAIHAAHPEELSLKVAYPSLYESDSKWHKALYTLLFQNGLRSALTYTNLFSLRSGNDAIVEKISTYLGNNLKLCCSAKKITHKDNLWHVETTLGKIVAEDLFLAVPKEALVALLSDKILEPLKKMPSTTIAAVHLGYHDHLTDPTNFGFLFPSTEKVMSTGIVCESAIFPQKDLTPNQSRFCVKFGSTGNQSIDHLNSKELITMAKDLLQKQLGISKTPDAELVTFAKKAIPCFEVDHQRAVEQLVSSLKKRYPRLILLGNYLHGAFVNQCVAHAHQISSKY